MLAKQTPSLSDIEVPSIHLTLYDCVVLVWKLLRCFHNQVSTLQVHFQVAHRERSGTYISFVISTVMVGGGWLCSFLHFTRCSRFCEQGAPQ